MKNGTKPRGREGRPGGPDKADGAGNPGELLRGQVALRAWRGTPPGPVRGGSSRRECARLVGVSERRRPAWLTCSEAPGTVGEMVRAA